MRLIKTKLILRAALGAALLILPATHLSAASAPQRRRSAARTRRAPAVYTVAAGKALRVRLNGELDSEKARVGDTFTGTIVDPVYSSGGVLVVPQASTVTGRVSNVTRARKEGEPATLDVQFVSLELPNGVRRAISGSLTDLSDSSSESDNEGTVSAKRTKDRNVKFIGGGAAGGAVLGAIAGGGKGALIGGVIGAGAGLLGSKLKKGGEVKVKSGTEFGVVLNRSVSLPKYTVIE